MNIAQDTVVALAKLSRLDLSEAEQKAFVQQLPKIIDYVGLLKEVTTDIVPEATSLVTSWRQDESQPSSRLGQILDQAPDREGRFWRVPAVL